MLTQYAILFKSIHMFKPIAVSQNLKYKYAAGEAPVYVCWGLVVHAYCLLLATLKFEL